MSEVSFEAFGDLAASDLPDTMKAGRHGFQAKAEQAIVDDIAGKLQLKPTDSLLDIGCGIGNITIPLVGMVRSVTVVDHDRVIDTLLSKPIPLSSTHPRERLRAYCGDFLHHSIGATLIAEGRSFDKILIYSVIHYLANEGEVLRFLQTAYLLLHPGGKLLVGDIPNADRKKRFEESPFGRAFSKAWAKRENGGNEFFDTINADENRVIFDAAVIRRLMKKLGLRDKDYSILSQPPDLPFGYTREDILITEPG